MILAAANAYIGLLVGLTVSASIPAAAVSMGVLRMFPKSNILENNLVQTSASAGESLVAGMIFTIPALVMMKAWGTYQYWPIVSIAIIGGILGVAFTIPLRRALIVEAALKYPEGLATAEVLKSGGIEHDATHPDHEGRAGSRGFKMLVEAGLIGGAFKALESLFHVVSGGVSTTKSLLGGRYLFTGDISLSPALIAVGYIVGLNIATLVFLGGFIGTVLGVPLNWALNSDALLEAVGLAAGTPFSEIPLEKWDELAGASWQNCRRIGVGAMIVGGVWSLISLAKPLMNGVRTSLEAYKHAGEGGGSIPRTELDTPIQYVGIVALLAVIPLFFVFRGALGDYPDKNMIAALMTVLMLVFGFIFSSVAGYMAGLVGSSNNPISGVTIATVIVSSLILLQLMGNEGPAATLGPIAVIFLAGLICSSAAIAGDNMQDLKCGHLLGATPWRQQIYQVVGVTAAAIVIPLVLSVLDNSRGIGRPSPVTGNENYLSAPQAGLMRDLSTGIFGAGIAWNFILMGCALAVLLIILDKIQEKRGSEFRFPVLAVAVGIYLPLGLSVPIFIGGLLAHFLRKRSERDAKAVRQSRENTGMLLASGLITGEALMGVLVAVIVAAKGGDLFEWHFAFSGALGLLLTTGVCVYLYRRTLQDQGEP